VKLIGMLDSPYVRRVAISLRQMGIAFEHESVSVFRHFDRFRSINPLVKAPTFICDDGTVLMDSTLIIDWANLLVPRERQLMPMEPNAYRDAVRNVGLGLVAMEKTVQVYYEETQRPPEKLHQPWHNRVSAQMATSYDLLETVVAKAEPWLYGDRMLQPDVTIAVAWRFTQFVMPGRVDPARYPALDLFSRRAEALPEFLATPLD
jgi:glutathione S-transferase